MNASAIPGSNATGLPISSVRLPFSRNFLIAASVVIFHVLVLWAMQNGMLRRAAEIVVPAEILTRIIEIEPPKVAPPPPPPPPPKPAPKVMRPPPMPVAVREPVPTPAPNAPTGVVEPQPPAPPMPVPAPPTPSPPAPPAPPRLVEVTEGETEYIRPPRKVYPSLSRRNGESGKVVIEVYYNVAGRPLRAKVLKSSGFERLDRAAHDAVMGSQITPFRRAGTDANTEYRLTAPFNFVLE